MRRWPVLIVAVILFLSGLALALMQLNRGVFGQIDALATANSDNVQWSLAQSDVELLSLLNAISDAAADPSLMLGGVRTRFDVFYSRANGLATSPMLQALREDPEVIEALDRISAYLDDTARIMDSEDRILRDALPLLKERTQGLRKDVRLINLRGVNVLSSASDEQRASIAKTLETVSSLTILLFCALSLAALLLLYFFYQERRRATEQSQIRSRLSAMVSSSLDAVIAVNAQGKIIEYNGAAERIFGYSADEAIGRQMDDLIVPDHLRQAHRNGMDRYRRTREKHVIGQGRVQLEAQRKDGEVFPVELSIETSSSEVGEIFVSFLRDISRRIASERELIKARDDAVAGEKVKADLIAVMSHEMRTPLNGMLGTLELFDGESRSEKERQYLDIIRASGKLLLHHVDNVLEISRADAGKIEIARTAFSVPALVRELVESQRAVAGHRGNSLSAMIEMQGQDYAVGDPTRIRQVLLNLIGNAIKFTRNGYITVEASRLSQGDMVEFRVTDTGIGVPLEDRERIFEDFVTRDASLTRAVGGTGLGLAIVRRLVKAMGGVVGLDSSVGHGSSFWVRLPLPVTQEQTSTQPPADRQGALPLASLRVEPMKILIVEDNPINRVVIRDLLEKDGHEVHESCDGQEGVERARQDSYDLVLMDISMPVMDGIQATREIRATEPDGTHLPIVALTANAIPSERDRFLAAGLDDILVKPITRYGLREILCRYSGRAASLHRLDTEDASVASDAVVDHGHIEELGSALGKAKLDNLLKAFLGETGKEIEDIAERLARERIDEGLRERVHRVAGSAALLGAEALRSVLVRVETQLVETGRLSSKDGQTLERIWDKTVPELQLHVSRGTESDFVRNSPD